MKTPSRYLGPYRILEMLGEGGLGVVYRAQHTRTLAQVALKTIRTARRELLACIREEIHALGRIRHPGVVRVLDQGVALGAPWFAMELLEGMNLDAYLDAVWPERNEASPRAESSGAPLSWSPLTLETVAVAREKDEKNATEADGSAPLLSLKPAVPPREERRLVANGEFSSMLTLLRHVSSTLAHIHGNGLVHLDLKPSNIFVRRDWTPALFDFSLVCRANMVGRERLAANGYVRGTLGYMAPEQFRGEVLDARTDLYALGCLMYECLTGQLPFVADSFNDFSRAHRMLEPIHPRQLVSGLPWALNEVILNLLAKRPEDRIGHASDVAHALSDFGAVNSGWAADVESRAYIYRPQLTGRAKDLRWLEKHLGALSEKGGTCVFVGGQSGMGRTRLMMEFARTCEQSLVRVVTGRCVPVASKLQDSATGRNLPLCPFRPLFQKIADHCLEKGESETNRILGRRGRILAHYEPALGDLPGQGRSPPPSDVPSESGRHRLLHAVGETLKEFCDGESLVLIVDDLQWIDELSLMFFSMFAKGTFGPLPLLLVGTYRSDEVSQPLRQLLDTVDGKCLREIAPLNEHEVEQIIGGMLGTPSPGKPMVSFLAQKSGGNPFFVAEYLRLAVSEGSLRRNGEGHWELKGSPGDALKGPRCVLSFPESLKDLVVRRLNDVPADSRRLLEFAASLGQEFELRVLQQVDTLEDDTIIRTVKDLKRRQILEDSTGGRIRFLHESLAEAAYEGIDPKRRCEVHRLLAEAIENAYGDTDEYPRHFAAAAHHWDRANVPSKAAEYLGRAGEVVLARGAYQQASGFFQQALKLTEDLRPTGKTRRRGIALARLARRIAECSLGLGDLPGCRKKLEASIRFLGYKIPRRRWSLLLSLAGQIGLQATRWLPSRSRGKERFREGAAAFNDLLVVTSFHPRRLPMLHAAACTTNFAERAGSAAELAAAYASLSAILGVTPFHHAVAEYYIRKGYAAAKSAPAALLPVLLADATYRLGRCSWEASLKAIEAGCQLARETGSVRIAEEFEAALSTYWFLKGDLAKSTHHANIQYRSALRGDKQGQNLGLLRICQNLLARDHLAQAFETLRVIRSLVEASPGYTVSLWYCALLGDALVRSGRYAEAGRTATHALSLARMGAPVLWYCTHAHACIATVFLTLLETRASPSPPDRKRLVLAARKACWNVFQSARVLPASACAARRLHGRYLWMRGNKASARREFEKSIELARRHGMACEEAWSVRELERRFPDPPGDSC